ncbi:hypothetical protein EON65_02990 [archaeon]|nr:MAG: hypothetical protein EON65_02990 [archaeon]
MCICFICFYIYSTFFTVRRTHIGICGIQLQKVRKVLEEKEVKFSISDQAVQRIITSGTDVQYGARPLKRIIQNVVLTPLASCLLDVSITLYCVS